MSHCNGSVQQDRTDLVSIGIVAHMGYEGSKIVTMCHTQQLLYRFAKLGVSNSRHGRLEAPMSLWVHANQATPAGGSN